MYKSKGLKYVSIQQVKDHFIKNKYATKNEIAQSTQLSHATITNILKELLNEKYIEQVEDCQSTGGRKAKRYKIRATFMYFGLFDLHVENQMIYMRSRVIDLDMRVIENNQDDLKVFSIDQFMKRVQQLKSKYHFEYIGIAVPAIVNNGKIEKSDIEELENMDLKTIIESSCQLQAVVENDVNTVMLGYIHRHAVDSCSVAFVYQPDNHHSGCGLYINHAILYGATHFAGELAYLPYGSLQEQEVMLKDNPLALLVKQVMSIIAIVNPSLLIIHAPAIIEKEFKESIQNALPKKHLPEFQFMSHMEEYIFEGLACQCIENSRFKAD